jgi:hypothetical protein
MRRWLATLTLCISLLIPVGLPVRPQDETAAELDEQRQTVYVIRTGKKYHSDRCRHLRRDPMSLRDAKAKGYTVCEVCHPPQYSSTTHS